MGALPHTKGNRFQLRAKETGRVKQCNRRKEQREVVASRKLGAVANGSPSHLEPSEDWSTPTQCNELAAINHFSESVGLTAEPMSVQSSQWQDGGVESAEMVLVHVVDFLPAFVVFRFARCCKFWSQLAHRTLITSLPLPQVDALLMFLLMEWLLEFDDSRLPLPLSAVYGEMCAVGRRIVAADDVSRKHLEMDIFRLIGNTHKCAQQDFLRIQKPHHIVMRADVRQSRFKTLEKMCKRFNSMHIIEIYHARWRKQIQNSKASRTCFEWQLMKVNRQHELFLHHVTQRAYIIERLALSISQSQSDEDCLEV